MQDISNGLEPFPIPLIQGEVGSFETYITDSIFPNGTPISSFRPDEDEEQDDTWTCSCVRVDDDEFALCTVRDSDTCDCVSGFGNFYTLPDAGFNQVLNIDALPERLPLVECSPQGSCAERCANRLTQRGVRLPLMVKQSSSGIGHGLFYSPPSGRSILPKGSFISLYAGEYLTSPQAHLRWVSQLVDSKVGEGNYILSLKLPDELWHIDPRYKGNIGRFLNHSCEPNCVIQVVDWGMDSLPRAAIFTKRDIKYGEELTFDYANASGSTELALTLEKESHHEQHGKKRTKCLCNSTQCRGWMPFDESL
ncbi:hypothetical protein I204_03962 [Kwoniella mangroviensis CBS 8886]|nr:hypothetical protein I204_03962 [Kwoniella mangroviensis CBS 8886]